MNGLISENETRIFDLMSNLADTTRARILLVLETQELNVSDLCAVLQMPQSTVSRHLKHLVDEGWLNSHADGTSRRYHMPTAGLGSMAAELWELVRGRAMTIPAARQDALRVTSVLADRRTRSQEFFASAAGDWDRLRHEMFGDRLDLQALLGLVDENWAVGDLGCGTGRISESIAPFVRRVVAVDSSREMLGAARDRLRNLDCVDVHEGKLEALPLAVSELDAAVFFLVLHYIVEPIQALREAARVVRPGGRVLIVDITPHDRTAYRRDMGHAWLGFGESQLSAWLVEAGLEKTRYHPLTPDPGATGPAVFVASARVPKPC